jgi:hypothetical protein
MNRRQIIFIGAGALVTIWLVATVVAWVAGTRMVTAEKVVATMEANPLSDGLSPEERNDRIETVAGILNRLDYKQREKFEGDPGQDRQVREYMNQMSAEERKHFVKLTIERHFEKVMKLLNEMAPEQRKKMVQESLDRMKREEEGRADIDRVEERDPEIVEMVMQEGFSTYYQDASAEVKVDMAPLLEEIQRTVERRRTLE